jgi:hypothetical protein
VGAVSTAEQTIDDPSGEGQLKFVGLGPSNSLTDIDDFQLESGVLLQKSSEDSSASWSRLTLGKEVPLGVRKNDTINSEDAGTSELLKNPPNRPNIVLENDYHDGEFRYESRRGGGHVFTTSEASGVGTKVPRFKIIDNESTNTRAEFLRLNQLDISGKTRIWDPGQQNLVGGGWGIEIDSDSANGETKIQGPSGVDFKIRPGFTTALNITESRVKIGQADLVAALEPQDVRSISSPQRGDIAYHSGFGNAGEGIGYYNGSNWFVLDGGTQP